MKCWQLLAAQTIPALWVGPVYVQHVMDVGTWQRINKCHTSLVCVFALFEIISPRYWGCLSCFFSLWALHSCLKPLPKHGYPLRAGTSFWMLEFSFTWVVCHSKHVPVFFRSSLFCNAAFSPQNFLVSLRAPKYLHHTTGKFTLHISPWPWCFLCRL